MLKKIVLAGLLVAVLVSTVGGIAEVQGAPVGPGTDKTLPAGPQNAANLVAILDVIVDWVFAIVMIFAIIFIVLAALQFIQGGGDPTAVGEARRKLLYAAIGIAVAVMAQGIPVVVRNIIGF